MVSERLLLKALSSKAASYAGALHSLHEKKRSIQGSAAVLKQRSISLHYRFTGWVEKKTTAAHPRYRAGLNTVKQGFRSEKKLFAFKSNIGKGLLEQGRKI